MGSVKTCGTSLRWTTSPSCTRCVRTTQPTHHLPLTAAVLLRLRDHVQSANLPRQNLRVSLLAAYLPVYRLPLYHLRYHGVECRHRRDLDDDGLAAMHSGASVVDGMAGRGRGQVCRLYDGDIRQRVRQHRGRHGHGADARVRNLEAESVRAEEGGRECDVRDGFSVCPLFLCFPLLRHIVNNTTD